MNYPQKPCLRCSRICLPIQLRTICTFLCQNCASTISSLLAAFITEDEELLDAFEANILLQYFQQL
jgi:hypothetical protein